jgi:hypothetical protein
MGLGRRQVYRVLTSFQTLGPDALVSKRRGKSSNRAHGAVFRKTILGIVRGRYRDFGATLAAEKLAELHGLPIGVETLRQWMIDDGFWTRRRDRAKRIHFTTGADTVEASYRSAVWMGEVRSRFGFFAKRSHGNPAVFWVSPNTRTPSTSGRTKNEPLPEAASPDPLWFAKPTISPHWGC